LTLVGGGGGRLDHHLANLLVIASSRYDSVPIDAWLAPAHVVVVRDRAELHARAGALCSLIPVHGPVTGVTTSGLRYALSGATLHPGSTHGVSNEFVDPVAEVLVQAGVLLAILPDALTDSPPHPGHDPAS
jgi:thiamine pyrophosphokinase